MTRELSLALVFSCGSRLCVLWADRSAAADFGMRTGIIDKPRPGEVQSRVIPRTGGYALFFAFLVAVLVGAYLIPRSDAEWRRLIGVMLGALAILPLAFMDDRRRPAAPPAIGSDRYCLHPDTSRRSGRQHRDPLPGNHPCAGPAGGTVHHPRIVTDKHHEPGGHVMDGLASGVAGISAVVLFARGVFDFGQYDIAILPVALAGVCAGFLPRNFPLPRCIFHGKLGIDAPRLRPSRVMGDTG